MMIDPFEVRMRFTLQLQHLSASVTSSQKAAHYALRFRDLDEDLHSCILEQLEKNNLNTRANIMSFIEVLCDLATKEKHPSYTRMIQRDILRIVDAVVPPDGTGAANVKHARRILISLKTKGILSSETVTEIDAALKDRDTHPTHLDLEQEEGLGDSNLSKSGSNKAVRLDKRQIEQRIEEDRERNKRLRESMWTVAGGDDEEFQKLWDEAVPFVEDDYIRMKEEADACEAARAYGEAYMKTQRFLWTDGEGAAVCESAPPHWMKSYHMQKPQPDGEQTAAQANAARVTWMESSKGGEN
ncbi:hypothetical protein N7495_000411 [Penicillium taxi]|uniref:uncharacterized protein n=1 Tax=Penicillium taxi TaxID=168475 RepID=UPI002545B2EF|nr:uncharacterized protein N7495_000411 [Penicillium taxi]KAJ5907729.1 hypothetical protein N7495_000411 [Penicillium taxi]